jgi:mRNA interferase RelE/StbE
MYSVGVKATALRELKALPAKVRNQTVEVTDKLELNPGPSGCKKLTGSHTRWRIRIGDYRILYEIDDTDRSVIIFRISHRKTAYR